MKLTFTSSLPNWIRENQELVKKLKDPEKILASAASSGIALVSERIQEFGQLSNGSLIGGGQYSKGYAKYRAKKGRQTQKIDYTFNGDLMLSFKTFRTGKFYVAGFADKRNADKQEWLEDKHGVAFELNDREIDLVTQEIRDNVNQTIRENK